MALFCRGHTHSESFMVWSRRGWFLGNVSGANKGHAMGSLNPRRRSWTTVRFPESHQRVLKQVGMKLDLSLGSLHDYWKHGVSEEEAVPGHRAPVRVQTIGKTE